MTISLKPLRIGPFEISPPFVLAALAGYTDLAFRLLCRQFGAPYCATEMMLDRLTMLKGKARSRFCRLTPEDHPIAGQIIGNEPATMADAARELVSTGFDVIDLNFACPVRKALSRRRGGYCMSQPDKTVEVIRAVCRAVPDKPVTLKLRQKFKNADDEQDFFEIAAGGFDAGVAAICVHARSVQTMYTGPADWSFLSRVRERFPGKTLIGSGDAVTPAKALAMIEQTGVDGVAIARGALGNPWFFRQVQDLIEGRPIFTPDLAEQRRVLTKHFADTCELYGPERGTKIMRGFGVKYARWGTHPKEIRMAMVKVKSPADWQAVLEKFYPSE